MSVGLGNLEFLQKEVQGDIDFDFFDTAESVPAKNGNKSLSSPCINTVGNQKVVENVSNHGEYDTNYRNQSREVDFKQICNGTVDNSNSVTSHPSDDGKGAETAEQGCGKFVCNNLNGHFGINCSALKCKCNHESDISSSFSSSESDMTSISPLPSDDDCLSSDNNLSYESEFENDYYDSLDKSEKNDAVDNDSEESSKFSENDNLESGKNSVEKLENSQISSSGDSTDLRLLVEAIKELELHCPEKPKSCISEPNRRKNLSFNNESVFNIEKENRRLLNKLVEVQKGVKKHVPSSIRRQKVSSATLNRQRQQKAIEQENLAILKRLKVMKPTKGITKDHLLKEYEKTRNYSIAAESEINSKSRPGSVAREVESRSATPMSVTNSSIYSAESLRKSRPEWNSRW